MRRQFPGPTLDGRTAGFIHPQQITGPVKHAWRTKGVGVGTPLSLNSQLIDVSAPDGFPQNYRYKPAVAGWGREGGRKVCVSGSTQAMPMQY